MYVCLYYRSAWGLSLNDSGNGIELLKKIIAKMIIWINIFWNYIERSLQNSYQGY